MKKLIPLLEICDLFKINYIPSSLACFDETIAPFRGRFKYNVYLPQKPDKWGIKLYSLCNSTNSYCLKLIPIVQTKVESLSELIMSSMKDFAYSIKYLFMDSYFSSIELSLHLKTMGIESTAIMRANRREIPSFLNAKYLKENQMGLQLLDTMIKKT